MTEEKGQKELLLEAENELIKFIRKNPIKNCNSLRIKYGKNWASKFEGLSNSKMIDFDESGLKVTTPAHFFI